ncbi:MAG: sulfotransferase [Acidimicrobiia bacterium]|nr:sulfotransferase [Acidimicrobiia bacterium]
MSMKIRISDLRDPQLNDLQKLARDYGETLSLDMSAESILEEATARTGLTDFGPTDFVARLDMWLDEVGNDPDRLGIGRLSLRNSCLRYASNRLLAHDLLRRHPEIHDIKIARPIIILGLPRTGTTHLLNVLSADAHLRSLPLWESYEPIPIAGESSSADGVDPRHQRCAKEWEQMQAVTPHVALMHPMDPDHVHEEIELMLPDFSSYNLEWVARCPQWRDHYLSHEQQPHYDYMHTMLKVLTFLRPKNRWVLKSPQHFEQIGPLMKTFPDACVVMTHRDPVSVIQSAATMMTYAARMAYRTIDPEWYIDYWTDRIERLLTAAVRDVHLIPDRQRIDVQFDDFMADDRGTISRVFAFAGHSLDASAQAQIEQSLTTRSRTGKDTVVYDVRADFNRQPEQIRERFSEYIDKFNVSLEVK